MSGVIYSIKSIPNDTFFEKLFMAFSLTLTVFVRKSESADRKSPKKYFLIFSICCHCLT